MRYCSFFLVILSLVLPAGLLEAQSDKALLHRIFTEDSTGADAIALYPQDVRKSIFESCMYPQVLVQMGNMQKDSRQQFKDLLSGYTREVQSDLWNLTRYPGLVEKVAGSGRKDNAELIAIASSYPEDIRPVIMKYGGNNYETLSKVHALNQRTTRAFDSLVSVSAKAGTASFGKLIENPEALSLLNSNMRLAVQLGDLQKRSPQLLAAGFDSLNLVLAQQHARDLEDWKNGLEKDPQAKEEFEKSAKEYQESEGSGTSTVVTEQVVVQYVYYPYPYWYGYPWWWSYPQWYPYPYWYDWGYYYGPYGIVYIGCPSHHFMHWYFHHHQSHYHYPHFSNHCVGYYYGHHRTAYSVNQSVGQWVSENKDVMPRNFLQDDKDRPQRLQEFGKFEDQYSNYQIQHPGSTITKKDYLVKNADYYPNMQPVLNEKPQSPQQKGGQEKDWQTPPPVQEPKTNVPKQNKPPVQPKTNVPKQNVPPVNQPKTNVPRQTTPPVQQPKQTAPKTNPPAPKTGKKK